MKQINNLVVRIVRSSGFSLPRVILTLLYIFVIFECAPRFTASVGNYPVQALSIFGLAASCLLLWRSLKLLFCQRVRDRISRFTRRIYRAAAGVLSRFTRKISDALGLTRRRAHGEDERDFIFRERAGSRRRARRLRNPLHWSELEENAARVRFIFIEYMLRRLRAGYRMAPGSTPDDISRELAQEEDEKLLFEAYRSARYSGGGEHISDLTVERLIKLTKKR